MRSSAFYFHRRFVVLLVLLAITKGAVAKEENSLNLIPAHAAGYCTCLHWGEQFQAMAHSHAWARLKEMPLVQMGLMFYQMQLMSSDSVPGQIQTLLKNPDNVRSVKFLNGLLDDEAFCYTNESFTDIATVWQDAYAAANYAPLELLVNGKDKTDQRINQIKLRAVLSSLTQSMEKLKAPDIVTGFKVKDPAEAIAQIARLEKIARQVIDETAPQWKDRIVRMKVGDIECLTFKLDGEMIPWSELPPPDSGDKAMDDQIKALIAHLKKQPLILALGVRGNYLLISHGASTDALAQFGKSPRLADRPEFKPLEKFADRKLREITYISPALHSCVATKPIDNLRKWLDKVASQISLSDSEKKHLRQDLTTLFTDIRAVMLPTNPSAVVDFRFAGDHGSETYTYDWTTYERFDGSRPLGLLSHLGGDPLFAIAWNTKPLTVEQYDGLINWIKVGKGYFEEYALPKMEEKDRQEYKKFLGDFRPLANRLIQVNREIISALDGQAALAVDAKLQSKQFFPALVTEKPMPMIEPAIVWGIKDAAVMRKEIEEKRLIVNDILKLFRQSLPFRASDGDGKFPELSIPEPKVIKLPQGGELFSFDLPKDWGVDKQTQPTIGLSDQVLVCAISRAHAERLLTTTPLKSGKALADPQRPRVRAIHCDWAATVDAMTPWIDLATEMILGQMGGGAAANDSSAQQQRQAVVLQVHTVLDVLKTFRCASSERYLDGDATVTHTVIEWQDVPEK